MTSRRDDVWAMVHAERQLLAGDLDPLPGAAWDTPSLCTGWSVHDVLAHLLESAMTHRRGFVWSMVRSRGDFDRANQHGIERFRRPDPQQTLAAFRDARLSTRTPPAALATRLVEAYVHGEDIRRPLGIAGDYPERGLHAALDLQLRTATSFGGGKERAEGLQLVDSGSRTTWGSGGVVTGHAVDLLLAVSGRAVDPDLLSGPGAGTLLDRA